MNKEIPLAAERRRRVVTLVIAFLIALVYFYEYPLYALLKVYTQYQGWTGMEGAPGLNSTDYLFLLVCASIVVFVYLRPRHYLRSNDDGKTFTLYRKGISIDTIAKPDLATLVLKTEYKRRSPSRDSGFIGSIKIYSAKNLDIVFYDSVPTRSWWYEKRVAKKLERQLGGDIEWIDKHGILSGKEDPERAARIRRREKQLEDIAAKSRRTPPKVVKAYGFRLFLLLVFAGFAAAFWYGGYGIAAYAFGGLSAVMLIDLVLTILGFGQQPEKK